MLFSPQGVGITHAGSSPARKDVQKELEIILEDEVLFHKRRGEHRAVVVAEAETGMESLCFKRHKDARSQVSLALLLSFQCSEMQRRQ